MFIGRKEEWSDLERKYSSNKSELVIVYGRRRIGKSTLLRRFCDGKPAFHLEGIEGARTSVQINNATEHLYQQTSDAVLDNTKYSSWNSLFSYLTSKVEYSSEKTILFFDEFQWLAAKQSKLVALVKFFWDNYWKDNNVMLILCGSIASFMINKVVKSKALYGRITLEMVLRGLAPNEAGSLLVGRSIEEQIQYQLVFGGVPKYLEEVDVNRSFEQNMDDLCFRKNGVMLNEFERVFYGQFKEATTYLEIVKALQNGPLSVDAISRAAKIASGGGLTSYLRNLTQAEFITSYVSIDKSPNSKSKRFTISDEYLNFYFKYLQPNITAIENRSRKGFFSAFIKPVWQSWLGLAFEKFCLKHAMFLADLIGFGDYVISASPYFARGDPEFQIDLLYKRMDNVFTFCEIKFHNKEITTKVIPELQKKQKLFSLPRGYTLETALISKYGPTKSLRDSGISNYHISLEDILHQGNES